MSDGRGGWQLPESEKVPAGLVGISPTGALNIYANTASELFDGPRDGDDVRVLFWPPENKVRIEFDPDPREATHTLSGRNTNAISLRSALNGIGADPPEETQHIEYEWDDEQEAMTLDLSGLVE